MSKIVMAGVFGAGYVLGTRAGRARYEELSAKAKEVWANPKVRTQVTKVQEQAKAHLPGSKGAGSGKHTAQDTDWASGTGESVGGGLTSVGDPGDGERG